MEDDEFNSLKSVLRELVVTSSKPANVQSLLWDYRNTVGSHIPLPKFGYQDLTTFLREKFSDCFLFQGEPTNPVLKLIEPTTSGTVQRNKNVNKVTRSLPESSPDQNRRQENVKPVSTKRRNRKFHRKPSNHHPKVNNGRIFRNKNMKIWTAESKKDSENKKQQLPKEKVKDNGSVVQKSELYMTNWTQFYSTLDEIRDLLKDIPAGVWCTDLVKLYKARYGRELDCQCFGRTSILSLVTSSPEVFKKYDMLSRDWLVGVTPLPDMVPRRGGDAAGPSGEPRGDAAGPSGELRGDAAGPSGEPRGDAAGPSGELRGDAAGPNGEPRGEAAGPSGELRGDAAGPSGEPRGDAAGPSGEPRGDAAGPSGEPRGDAAGPSGELRGDAAGPSGEPPSDAAVPSGEPRSDAAGPSGEPRGDAARPSGDFLAVFEVALPGIPYAADVFPADCMQLQESIPEQSLAHIAPGELLDVWVTEVYSPSHFWVQLLGELHSIAIDNMMYEMTEYYDKGEGCERRLEMGAMRVGHYCSSIYDGVWHRAVIVKILDCDTVKVRYVDFGTVETCAASTLRVLCRKWAALPAQAIRARAADVRPAAAGRQWPCAAAAYFVLAVKDKDLVANVFAVDRCDAVLEVFLVDPAPAPAPAGDVWINTALIAAGHADPRACSVPGTSECYLYPRFDALETGATPNYNEIQNYLRSGIALADVEDYRWHVLLRGSRDAWDALTAQAPPPPQSVPPGFAPLMAPCCAPEFVATVTLFVSEVEMFLELGRRNPLEAYNLMGDALSRAVSAAGCRSPCSTASVLNPDAAEIRPASESSRR